MPAKRFGFAPRGRVAPGFQADLVRFDPLTVLDKATIAEPVAPPVGLPGGFAHQRLADERIQNVPLGLFVCLGLLFYRLGRPTRDASGNYRATARRSNDTQ